MGQELGLSLSNDYSIWTSGGENVTPDGEMGIHKGTEVVTNSRTLKERIKNHNFKIEV